MNKKVLVVAATLLCMSVDASGVGNVKAQRALQLINHINCAVSEITQSKDKLVLEREYNALTVDALKLDSIDDYETVETIKTLLNTAKKLRISTTEREMLQEEIEEEMSEAIYNSMPNIGAMASPNLLSTAINLTVGAASAYMNYEKQKKAIQRRAKKANWAIDKDDIETLDALNQDLLEQHWKLVKRYGFDDYQRVTAKSITQLIDHFKDPDKKRRHEFFRLHESEYATSTRYWYYRSVAAMEDGKDTKDAATALDRFQAIHLQITRKDKIAALVAMQKVQLLLDGSWNNSAIRKQLEIIERNADADDWNLFYFCGLVYANKLSDLDAARRVLKIAINQLSFRQDKRLKEFRSLVEEKGASKAEKESYVPKSDGLLICRMQLQMIENGQGAANLRKQLLDSISKENAMLLDSLYYLGRTSDEKILLKLLPDILSIVIVGEYNFGRKDSFYAYIPIKWFQVSDLEPKLVVDCETLSEEERVLQKGFEKKNWERWMPLITAVMAGSIYVGTETRIKMDESVKPPLKNDMIYVKLRFRKEIDRIDSAADMVELNIPHKYCNVALKFRLPRNADDKIVAGVATPFEVVIDGTPFSFEVRK